MKPQKLLLNTRKTLLTASHFVCLTLMRSMIVSLSPSQSFTIVDLIEKISRVKNETKVLLCPYFSCFKEFSETGNLKTHMRTHSGERPFSCGYCSQSFITKGHLQAHQLTHTGQRPFICKICNKKYSRAGRLKIHMKVHQGSSEDQHVSSQPDDYNDESGSLNSESINAASDQLNQSPDMKAEQKLD